LGLRAKERISKGILLLYALIATLLSSHAEAQFKYSEHIEIELIVEGQKTDISADLGNILKKIPAKQLENEVLKEVAGTQQFRNISLQKLQTSSGNIKYLLFAEKLQKIGKVSLEGIPFLEENEYRRLLETKLGSPINEMSLSLDAIKVKERLIERGYLNAKLTSVNKTASDPGIVDVVFTFDRGRPCRIAEVIYVPERPALNFLSSPLEAGALCDLQSIREALEKDRNRLRNEGFLKNEISLISLEPTADKERAIVKLKVLRGLRTRIEVVNESTGAVLDDFPSPESVSLLDVEFLADEELRTAVQGDFLKKGFARASVKTPLRQMRGEEEVLRFFVQTGAQYSVRNIEFRGKLPFTREELLDKLELVPGLFQKGIPFIEADLQKYQEGLKSILQEAGYRDATVEPPVATYSDTARSVDIVFRAESGPLYIVKDISTTGKPSGFSFDDEALFQNLEPGSPFTDARLELYVKEMHVQLFRAGYAYSDILAPRLETHDSQKEKKSVRIFLEVNPGPLIRIRRITIEGDTFGKEERILSEAGLTTGDIFNRETLEKARQRLLIHGLFSSVEVEPAAQSIAAGEKEIDVVIRTRKRGGYSLGLGPGWGNKRGYVFDVNFTLNNLTADGLRFFSEARISQAKDQSTAPGKHQLLERHISLGVIEPLIKFGNWTSPFDATASVGFGARAERLNNRNYQSSSFDLSWRPLLLGYSWRFNLKFLQEVSEMLDSGLTPLEALDPKRIRIHEVLVGTGFDNRNNRDWPTSGFLGDFSMGGARFGFLSDVQFNRYILDTGYFFPLYKRLSGAILLGGVRVSDVVNRSRADKDSEMVTVPDSRRASLSSQKAQIRGFWEPNVALGPLLWRYVVSPDNDPEKACPIVLQSLGATNVLYLKGELRYRSKWFTENLGFATFVDTGSAYFTKGEEQKISEKLANISSDGDGTDCRTLKVALVGNDAVDLKKGTGLSDYFKSSYVSSGFGVRYIVPNFASLNLDWGFPVYDPSEAVQTHCATPEEAKKNQGRERANVNAPQCVQRKGYSEYVGMRFPGAIHFSIGASL
jgi:outer membrane protein insertion porin family